MAARERFDALMGRASVPGSPRAGRGKKSGKRPRYLKRAPGVMDETEEAFAREVLDPMVLSGEIDRYDFEEYNLRLGVKLHYRPDFAVYLASGEMVFYEVKGGRCEEDALVKIKAAADKFPQRFILARKLAKKEATETGSRWDIREIPGRGGW